MGPEGDQRREAELTLNGNAAGSAAAIGAVAEADVRLTAVATHEFYEPRHRG